MERTARVEVWGGLHVWRRGEDCTCGGMGRTARVEAWGGLRVGRTARVRGLHV